MIVSRNIYGILSSLFYLICSITEEVNAIRELRLLITCELERMRYLLSERRKMLLAGATRSPVCSGVTQKVTFTYRSCTASLKQSRFLTEVREWKPSVWPFKWKILLALLSCVHFIMLYKVVLTFKPVDEALICNHSNEGSLAALSFHAVHCWRCLSHIIL